MEEEFEIKEEDIQQFFLKHLIAAGVMPDEADLDVISEIVLEYLVEIGVLLEY